MSVKKNFSSNLAEQDASESVGVMQVDDRVRVKNGTGPLFLRGCTGRVEALHGSTSSQEEEGEVHDVVVRFDSCSWGFRHDQLVRLYTHNNDG